MIFRVVNWPNVHNTDRIMLISIFVTFTWCDGVDIGKLSKHNLNLLNTGCRSFVFDSDSETHADRKGFYLQLTSIHVDVKSSEHDNSN